MPYALFTNNEQISKAYKTEHEVWKNADEAGLVVDVASEEEKAHPKRVLDSDFCIKPCPADADHEAFQSAQDSTQKIRQQPNHAQARSSKRNRRPSLAAVKS